jgi:YgiT-type zinc finger domain-containing protein
MSDMKDFLKGIADKDPTTTINVDIKLRIVDLANLGKSGKGGIWIEIDGSKYYLTDSEPKTKIVEKPTIETVTEPCTRKHVDECSIHELKGYWEQAKRDRVPKPKTTVFSTEMNKSHDYKGHSFTLHGASGIECTHCGESFSEWNIKTYKTSCKKNPNKPKKKYKRREGTNLSKALKIAEDYLANWKSLSRTKLAELISREMDLDGRKTQDLAYAIMKIFRTDDEFVEKYEITGNRKTAVINLRSE